MPALVNRRIKAGAQKYKNIDAIVHLAALPAPGMMASSTQFQLNAMSCVTHSLFLLPGS